MTDIQKINAASRAEFDRGNYASAFQNLLEAGAEHFILYSQKVDNKTSKTNWFVDSNSAQFFWTEFLLQKPNFHTLLKSDEALQLLHNYFSRYQKQVLEFEIRLAQEFPQSFVQSIRFNQVFLNPKRLETLKTIPLKNEYHIHLKMWTKIYETEQSMWQEIESEMTKVMKYSLEDILCHCTIWLETNRFEESSQEKIHHLACTYSFFIEYVMSNSSLPNLHFKNELEFFEYFLSVFKKNSNNDKITQNSSVSQLLFRISNWINFKENVISPYSFDANIEPIQENEQLFIKTNPTSYYSWILNGVRYQVNQLRYYFQGSEFVEVLEMENPSKIPGKNLDDIQLNRTLAAYKYGTLMFLEDMACEHFKIGKNRIDCIKLLNPLFTFSFNRLNRYENSLKQHFQNSLNWSEAYLNLLMATRETKILRAPFVMMNENEYKSINQEALSHLTEDSTDEVITLFSSSITKKTEFNRFQTSYEVWQKPFIKIGNFLFCPMLFFANNFWFYSFSQAALFQKTERSETEKMENHLGACLSKKGWKVKVTSNIEASKMQGDIDLFVEDESAILLIQLKRTYFRLNAKDAYYESRNTDSKAAEQLNEAANFLKFQNTIYHINNEPYKWIVSTSFENIGANIEGCIKINYFELLNALKNTKVKKLKDLIQNLILDKNMKFLLRSSQDRTLIPEIRQLVYEVSKPLSIFESKKYKQLVFSEDENRTKEYLSLFNNAIELDNQNRKNEALVQLHKCTLINPNDEDAYAAIANILADMKSFDNSFIAFKRALELAPKDPFITRNYCVALIESGKWFEGLSKIIELYEIYPMLGDIRILFEENFKLCLKNGQLDDQQLINLKKKWDSLT